MTPRWLDRWRGHTTTGDAGERLAARHLRAAGYKILATNHRTRRGELDLIALAPDGRAIVFAEVKTSDATSNADYAPERRVSRDKQHQIARLAAAYCRAKRLTDRPVRFDVLGVTLTDPPQVRHYPGAFDSPW